MSRKIGIVWIIALFAMKMYGENKFSVYTVNSIPQKDNYCLLSRDCAVYGGNNNYYFDHKVFDKQSIHWKKYKKLKALAWTSAAIGVPALGLGYFGGIIDGLPEYWSKVKPGWQVMFYTGLCLTIASVPLFVYAHKYKMKALMVSVGSQSILTPLPGGTMQSRPALAVRIHF